MSILKDILKTATPKNSFYIPEGMTMTGTFTSDVPGQIAGALNGDLIVNGRLSILKSSVIIGNVKAQELEIWGRVIGYIQCSGKIFLQKACYVKGNISTAEILIEKGAVVDGIVFKPGQNKTEEAPPRETAAGESSIETVEVPDPVNVTVEEGLIDKVEEEKVNSSWF